MTDAIVVPLRRGYMARSKASDWRTPPEIVTLVREVFGGRIGVDPCAAPDIAHVIADENLTGPAGSACDGLAEEWRGDVYVNPPFADLAIWAEKAAREAKPGTAIVMLLPARTDTRYWHDHIATATAIAFMKGRLRFVGAPGPCPFPTALAYWGPRPWDFHRVVSPRAMVVTP